MAESLEDEPAKLIQAQINELMQNEVDIETLQQLLQVIANKDKESEKHASNGENDTVENKKILKNGVETEEFSETNFSAVTVETVQLNEELTNESEFTGIDNQPETDQAIPDDITPETNNGNPAPQDGFAKESHQVEPAVDSNVNESKGSTFRWNNEDHLPKHKTNNESLSPSQAALPQTSSMLPDNLDALQISQTTHITQESKLPSQVIIPSDKSAINFDSAVPPILIPLSKSGLYLPKTTVVADADTPIPLPYQPLMVIKGQTAAIVFEHISSGPDKQESNLSDTSAKLGVCGECGKNLTTNDNPFSDSIENNLISSREKVKLSVTRQTTSLSRADEIKQEQDDQLLKQQQMLQQQQQVKQPQEGQQRQQQLVQQQQPHSYTPVTHQPLPTQQYQQQQDYKLGSSAMSRRSSVPSNFDGSSRSLPEQILTNNGSSTSPKVRVPGLQAPVWTIDSDVKNCFQCGKLFTLTRRKHHCRGCGKIFCSDCCNQLAQLPYLRFSIARICVVCTQAIKKVRAEKIKQPKQEVKPDSRASRMSRSASMVNEALVYVPRDEPSSSFVGGSGFGGQAAPNQRSNFMAPETLTDGSPTASSASTNFMPNAKLMETPGGPTLSGSAVQSDSDSSLQRIAVNERVTRVHGDTLAATPTEYGSFTSRDYSSSLKMPLRPAGRTISWMCNNESKASIENQRKRFKNTAKALKSPEGVIVQAAEELTVRIKKIQVVVKQSSIEVWFLRSKGFKSCGQKEIAFLLEKRINEEICPYELLKIYRTLYSMTLNQGERFEHGNYLAFHSPLLGNEDNKGFLFVSSDMAPRAIQNLAVSESFLYGILVKQSELHCAKYLPTRLLIALGVQQQCYPCPAVSRRDRPSVCHVEPSEMFYSTLFAFNKFLNHKTPQALIPGVHIIKSGGKVALELPLAYQTEIISIFDSLLVNDDKPVTIPVAGDLVLDASGHFVYSPSDLPSARRGFFVLQNNNQEEPGNQYLAFSALLLVLTFGEASSSHSRFGVEVIEDGIKVTLAGGQAKEIRQSIYQGTNCSLFVGNAESQSQFILRWTSESSGSLLSRQKTVVVKQDGVSTKGYPPTSSPSARNVGGQTNVIIDRVQTRDTEIAIEEKIVGNPDQVVRKLENDVRQACAGSLLTFANRLRPNAEKRLNLTLSISPGYKKWSLGPNNQPINLARSLQLALNEIGAPETNGEITFVFNVILQKRN